MSILNTFMVLREEIDPSEEQIENFLEGIAEQTGNIDITAFESSLMFFGVIAVAVVSGLMFIRKKQKEEKIKEELSNYYDDYMESDVDMGFEDYIFCRKHHIDVDRKMKEKKLKALKMQENDDKPENKTPEDTDEEDQGECE